MGVAKDLKGKKFGRLTVLNWNSLSKKWECICECGKHIETTTNHLTMSQTKSCGCYMREKASKLSEKRTKHGMARKGEKKRIYRIWCDVKSRCSNPKATFYKYYGGKGIEICNEWANDFQNFNEWACKNGYNENLTLDRKDGEKNYNPDNCRWVTMKVQNSNRISNIYIMFKNVIYTMQELADKENIIVDCLYKRRRSNSKWYIENCKEVERQSEVTNG